MTVRVLEVFAGGGGLALGWHRAGAEHVGFVESAEFPRRLLARHWPDVPQWGDLLSIDSGELPACDILSGGPPCQPVSCAGRGAGTADERWLWGDYVALGAAIGAPVIVAENPPGLLTNDGGRTFAAVLGAFGSHGYRVEWQHLAAATVGAPHWRERVFLVGRRDGRWTWGVEGQPELFGRRGGKWPMAGRWDGRLEHCAELWPTPADGAAPWQVDEGRLMLPTPRAADREGGPTARDVREGGPDPRTIVGEMLPTPQAHDARGAPGRDAQTRGAFESSLPARVREMLPTPAARDHRDGRASDATRDCNARPLNEAVTPRDHTGPALLSPALHEWMMGLPPGWGEPDGPSLAESPSRPWGDPLPRSEWLTTVRPLRRPRLQATGNAVVVQVAETIARSVMESM